ncbi:putative lipoprotein [Spiroplasma kunkelii CR2-3x]|uniref:Putative lipoprotein n=1 Tax=Spiroplasma kunkelii CR2-3x TaxID=273035 RepID=A0A0K2JIF4_SPIKU|nr:lipoprotein [Spiroplasma kunkelii]ALA98364.1 putative lipoprotein [Spiroplasma kunkelii CR2-3x]
MKKWLSFLGAITLLGTSTTSLVACNTPQYSEDELTQLKQANQICTNCQEIKEKLEWIAPQEKPFNTVDNKYYFVVWRDSKNSNWNINKFNNNKEIILITGDMRLQKTKFGSEYDLTIRVPEIRNMSVWKEDDRTYFKAVYRWNGGEENLPDLIIDNNGNVKFNGE